MRLESAKRLEWLSGTNESGFTSLDRGYVRDDNWNFQADNNVLYWTTTKQSCINHFYI